MSASYIPPADIRLASLDPPDKTCVLPPIMKKINFRMKDLKLYGNAPIFDTLPRSLIPSSRRKYKPPVMHYGWPVPTYDPLIEVARRRDLVIWEELWDYECEGDSDDPDEVYMVQNPPSVNEPRTVRNMLKIIGKQLSQTPPRGLTTLDIINHKAFCIVSVYTNFDLVRPVSDEFVEQLRVELGFEEKARWFLDADACHWRLQR